MTQILPSFNRNVPPLRERVLRLFRGESELDLATLARGTGMSAKAIVPILHSLDVEGIIESRITTGDTLPWKCVYRLTQRG